ncbi:MAG: hypothetical protein AAGE52_07770 [Myxococcota bacterium]
MAALVLVLFAVGGQAQERPNPADVAAEVQAEGGYADELQFRSSNGIGGTFPFGGAGGGGRPDRMDDRSFNQSGRGSAEGRQAGEGGSGQAPTPDLNFGGGLLSGQVMSSVLLVGVVLLLIALVVVLFFALRSDTADPPPVTRPREIEGKRPMEPLLLKVGDPDALAAEGRFSEAILALLVQSLEHVGWKPLGERSRTAREVLWALSFQDPRRSPLAEVVGRAERVRFAGDAATRALFDEVKGWRDQLRSITA